jgi:serine/threonine-protein kinase
MTPGTVIASTYAIERELARTETGVVYEAREKSLDRVVALKLGERGTLLAEAKRCAAVPDPCAVHVYAMGEHAGREYAVGERVVGHLLRTELDGELPPDVYLARLRMLVAAVARAHECGIAIGDISGATVLACERQRDRLVLGRLSLSQVPAFGRHGRILAPEVVRGEVQASDPAAAEAIDLYGLGCVAVELARGEPPFADPDPQIEMKGHATLAPLRLVDLRGDLPSELSDLIDWLLAKRPGSRPRSASEVLAQLDVISERANAGARTLRVLVVDDDTPRARWLWSLARRAHAGAIVETASEGTDAGHKLNRDHPDLVFIDAQLRGAMNALELCMYARGLRDSADWRIYLVGSVGESDRALFEHAHVDIIPDDPALADAIVDTVRSAATTKPRPRRPSLVSG